MKYLKGLTFLCVLKSYLVSYHRHKYSLCGDLSNECWLRRGLYLQILDPQILAADLTTTMASFADDITSSDPTYSTVYIALSVYI